VPQEERPAGPTDGIGAGRTAVDPGGTVVVVVAGTERPGSGVTHPGPTPDTPPSAATVAIVAPPASSPTTVVPARAVAPVAASTTTPDEGTMASSTAPVGDSRCTEATSPETTRVTTPTGPPSASPNEVVSTNCTVLGASVDAVGAAIDVDQTARSVESSTVSCWQPVVGGSVVGGTVVGDVGGEEVVGGVTVVGAFGVVTTVPEAGGTDAAADAATDAAADAADEPVPAPEPATPAGSITGRAHTAVAGHGTVPGGTGVGQVAVTVQPTTGEAFEV